MPLPKLDTPTYSLVLPSTGQTIKYRPFLVKEQKIMMVAQESEQDNQMYQVMSDVVKSCTFNEIDTETSPILNILLVSPCQPSLKAVTSTLTISPSFKILSDGIP